MILKIRIFLYFLHFRQYFFRLKNYFIGYFFLFQMVCDFIFILLVSKIFFIILMNFLLFDYYRKNKFLKYNINQQKNRNFIFDLILTK